MVWLELEDYIFNIGPSYEYINTEQIFRIRATRKRIRIYRTSGFNYIFVAKNKHNIEEIKLKLGVSL